MLWRESFLGAHRRTERRTGVLAGALGITIAVAGVLNVARYLRHPEWHGGGSQNHLVVLGQWLREHGENFDRICIDVPGLFPYLYVAVFSGMSPDEFRSAPREGIVTAFGWEKFDRFGRFHFTTADEAGKRWEASGRKETWLLVTADGRTRVLPRQPGSRTAPDAIENESSWWSGRYPASTIVPTPRP